MEGASGQPGVVDLCNMAWWWPRIHKAGLPTPPTCMVHTELPLHELLDGPPIRPPEAGPGKAGHLTATDFSDFLLQLMEAADKVRYGQEQFFLRTGHTSGKHSWEHTCYVQSHSSLGGHVYNLVEESALAGIHGLPVQDWAVRAMLPTKPIMVLPRYGNMPLVREYRYFVRDAVIEHVQPYWPEGAVAAGLPAALGVMAGADWMQALAHTNRLPAADDQRMAMLAKAACRAVGGGYWSVDMLESADGTWWVTDMATGDESYRYVPDEGWRG